jgi:hypothetical protein
MGWVVEKDIDAYADRVLPWLGRDPAWNSVASTVLVAHRDGTVRGDDPWLAWLPDGSDAVAAVALRTPPRGLLLSRFPAGAVRGLVDVAPADLPEAVGPAEQVGEFATAYARRTGATPRLNRHDLLYELTEPVEPPRPAGEPLLAEDGDAGALLDQGGRLRDRDRHGDPADVESGRDGHRAAPGPGCGMLSGLASLHGRAHTDRRQGEPDRAVWTPPEHTPAGVTRRPPNRHRRRPWPSVGASSCSPTSATRRRPGYTADRLPAGRRLWDEWLLEY